MSQAVKKRPTCFNCKHASEGYKIAGTTHHTCLHPKWKKEDFESGKHHPYDTLQEFWNTCNDHEFRQSKELNQKQK